MAWGSHLSDIVTTCSLGRASPSLGSLDSTAPSYNLPPQRIESNEFLVGRNDLPVTSESIFLWGLQSWPFKALGLSAGVGWEMQGRGGERGEVREKEKERERENSCDTMATLNTPKWI